MPTQPSLERIPDISVGPATHVQINVTGGEPGRSVQFFINDVLRGTIPLDLVGNGTLFYIVPAGQQRNALADCQGANGNWDTVDGINLVYLECDSGSMALRYAP